MKKFICALALLTSVSSFAGTFVKEDLGFAVWSVKVNKTLDGYINVNRHSQTIETAELSSGERKLMSSHFNQATFYGNIGNDPVKFENSDERSQESAVEFIKKKLVSELSVVSVEVLSHDFEFKELNCRERGLIKRELICSGKFISRITAEFK